MITQTRMNESLPSRQHAQPGWRLTSLWKGRAGWHLDRWQQWVPVIADYERQYQSQSDPQLRKESLSLRYRAKAGEALASFLPQAFALVREAANRTIGLRHFDVQLLGGMALFHGAIAEMDTGEGKTLTATLPLYLHALRGKGAHLATVNDYLAARDAEWMRPIYELLGLSVGVVQTDMSRPQRRKAYACDITYGTAKEFGFDFLRDCLVIRRMKQERLEFLDTLGGGKAAGGERPVQRDPHYGLVDEADSILIDEARTPLIISAIGDAHEESIRATYAWAAEVADEFQEDDHYEYDHEKKKVELTAAGRQLARALPKPDAMNNEVGLIDTYEYVERAVKVSRDFLLNQHYVVSDKGEIVIVDEFTGRLAEGRKWRDGIHQAIEAKERVEVTVDTGQAARITIQDLFLRYQHLAGMTGTALTSAREFRKIYKCLVVRIPTNRPVQRERLDDRVFKTGEEKWQQVVREIVELHEQGRPVLIGTRTIEKSELLSEMLIQQGIEHEVLNARHIAREAAIVAQAGQPARVTVATNMAGRGTDIKLGEGVAEIGGLHVIVTEIHDAARIDRQLAGRCGRQGDPGTYRRYLAVDDDILKSAYGPAKAQKICQRLQRESVKVEGLAAFFRRSQRKVERRHLRDRMVLLHHEKQRKKMQRELGQDPYLDTPS